MHSDPRTDAIQDEWLVDDDVAAAEIPEGQEPWRILIVDDDVDVHVVTKFSLRNATFKGRPLIFFHAYSGKEGLSMMRTTPDVALVLLDVVMETDNAGLILARQIRGELGNHVVRVVLRTGQSGQALEQSVIVDYDINDYRTKSDLTTQKLFTTVISALRSYDSILTATRSQDALKIALAKIKELRAALDLHTVLSVTDEDGRIVHVNDQFCALSQYARDDLLGKDHRSLISVLHNKEFLQAMWLSLRQGTTWQGDLQYRARDGSVFWLATSIIPILNPQGKPYHYLGIYSAISDRNPA